MSLFLQTTVIRSTAIKNNYVMETKQDTVTISLETYKKMEAEIKSLRIQVQQKTIYKNILPPIYGQVMMCFIIIFFVYTMLS